MDIHYSIHDIFNFTVTNWSVNQSDQRIPRILYLPNQSTGDAHTRQDEGVELTRGHSEVVEQA